MGGRQEVAFDIRVIAATHRDLKAAAAGGEFREDLYFRLAVVSIEAPPLRARGEDVLLLAQEMLEEHHAAGRTGVRGLTDAAAERFLRHPWPGNVRELRDCIDRAVALARHPWLTVADLPASLRTPSAGVGHDDPGSLVSLAELELRHMRRVLHAVGGNKTVAARILGCDRRTLYRKLGPDAEQDAPGSH